MKRLIKDLLPPLFLRHVRSIQSPWQGPFSSWEEANKQTTGYNQDEILERVSSAIMQVKSGHRPYERDSILFDEITYSWPLVSALQHTFMKDGYLNVLDFGGSLGSSYFQNIFFLQGISGFSWNVIEQENFVYRGKAEFEDDHLKFFSSLKAVTEQKKINFVLISSVLQYLEKPYEILNEILEVPATTLFLDRLAVIDSESDVISVQTVPPEIYKASYPCWFFNEKNIKGKIQEKYELLSEFESYTPNSGYLKGMKFDDKGYFFLAKTKLSR